MVRHTGEDFIDEESVAVALVFLLQSACINSTELDTPKSDRFAADSDDSFSKQVFDIAMAVNTRLRLNRK